MARWKLTEAHYLSVPDTKWEYSEVDRRTGRPKRTQFPVPLLLDPKSLDDLKGYGQSDPDFPSNQPDDYIIVVAQGETSNPKDVIFAGPPTPGMLPLDDEARAITAKHSHGKWSPTAGLDVESQNESYSNKLLSGLIDEMTSLKYAQQAAPAIPGMEDFMKVMAGMMQQQTAILTALTKTPAPGGIKRRVA